MLSYKDSEQIMRSYANEYNKSKIVELRGIELLNNSVICEGVCSYMDSEEKYTYYYNFQNKIDSILDQLDWDCSSFLKREFFDANRRKLWWNTYYSRSTYYRLKKKYMSDFLRLAYA